MTSLKCGDNVRVIHEDVDWTGGSAALQTFDDELVLCSPNPSSSKNCSHHQGKEHIETQDDIAWVPVKGNSCIQPIW